MTPLNIAYACNDGYIVQTGISIISLCENNKDIDNLNIYLISKDISTQNINIIRDICNNYHRRLIVIDFAKIAYDLHLSSTGRHIETIYAKIFFGRIPDIDTIFYLDSDTIVNRSLKGLLDIDLSGYYMGMVETFTGSKAKKELKLRDNNPFFNDGVAYINVKFCRDNNLIDKCNKLIAQYNGNPPLLSEGVLNFICKDKILKLSPRFNMMAGLYQYLRLSLKYVSEYLSYSTEDLLQSFRQPVVIHYLSGLYNRPWCHNCTHPLKERFLHYKNLSPWKDTPLIKSELPLKLKILGKLLNFIGPYNFKFITTIFK